MTPAIQQAAQKIARVRIWPLLEPFCTPQLRSREPLEPVSTPFARSAAYERVKKEIFRYTLGEISGRAFLISGHRGSGKSTLVRGAIQSVQEDFHEKGVPHRPIFVRLHGPDLLPARSGADDNELVLRQVTIALYRALADEFSHAYRNFFDPFDISKSNWFAMERFAFGNTMRDYRELAAQLRMELDGGPSPATLREFWDKAGRLYRGVLFPRIKAGVDQGLLELIALSSAAQAYRVVTGKIEETQGAAMNTARTQSAGIEAGLHVKDFFAPLLALGSGAAVGAGAAQMTNPLLAGLLGSAAAIASAVTLNYSSKRSRDTTTRQEVTFLPDRTVASLDRMLPLLVERVRDAGLAPVFVVDELDKVDRLYDRMRSLVKHLKHFVTERAFFCFITDRNYFEQLNRQSLEGGYPEEYTYFTDRLFISFAPQALHEFLDEAIFIAGEQEQDQAVLKSLELDATLFEYLLLGRARLHVFDVGRQLAQMFDSERDFKLPKGALQLQVYRFQIAMQVAIELLLRKGALATRLQQDPDFTQIAYDALYYPARCWERGDKLLNISEAVFTEDLNAHTSDPDYIGPGDRKMLRQSVRRVVELLSDIRTLVTEVKDARNEGQWDVPQEVVAALPLDYRLLTPTVESPECEVFDWVYTIHGLPFADPDLDKILTQELDRAIELIERMSKHLADNHLPDLQKLAIEYRVLNTSPAWSEVQTALNRIKRARETRQVYPEMESHASILREYHGLLTRSGKALGLALVRAGQLRGVEFASLAKYHASLDRFLVLSTELNLSTLTEEQTFTALQSIIGAPPVSLNELDLFRVDFWDWAEKTKIQLELSSDKQLASMRDQYWKSWLARVNTAPRPPEWHELLAKAQGLIVSRWLRQDPSQMTLPDWSEILVQSIARAEPTADLEYCPASFGVVALAVLGFASRIPALLDGAPSGSFHDDWNARRKEFEDIFGPVKSLETKFPAKSGGGVAVLSRTPDTITRSWGPSRIYSGLILPPARLEQLLKAVGWNREILGISTVVVEAGPDPASALDATYKQHGAVASFVGSQPNALLVPQRNRTATIPVIAGASSLDDAMEQFMRLNMPPDRKDSAK